MAKSESDSCRCDAPSRAGSEGEGPTALSSRRSCGSEGVGVESGATWDWQVPCSIDRSIDRSSIEGTMVDIRGQCD